VTPWVLASSGVIHAGSTVSLEAKLAGKTVGLLAGNAKIDPRNLTTITSDYIVNKNGRKDIIDKESELSDFVFLESEPSINRIIDEIKKIELIGESKVNKLMVALMQLNLNKLIRLVGLIKHEIKWKLKLTTAPPYTNFVPKGIRKRDITKITHSEKVSSGVRIRRITLNCWELD
jgi:hypothetical protein